MDTRSDNDNGRDKFVADDASHNTKVHNLIKKLNPSYIDNHECAPKPPVLEGLPGKSGVTGSASLTSTNTAPPSPLAIRTS